MPPLRRGVLLATCREYPSGDEDAAVLGAALGTRGVDARWVSWDDSAVDWSAAAVVLRSTWDYTPRLADFLAWTASVPTLFNPAPVVRWSSDKTYLGELADAGVPVVASRFAAPGEPVPLELDDLAGEVVVKPAVGAGSRGVGRFGPDERPAARNHAAALHEAGRTVVVQPYLAGVDAVGESALVYVDGRFSHAIGKRAMLTADGRSVVHRLVDRHAFVPESITARAPSAVERDVAEQAVAYLTERFGTLLYVRVDLLPGPGGPGDPVVGELEAVEPSLFLTYADGAADRLAAAIAARL